MKFSVGYQFFDENGDRFADDLIAMKDRVEEVFFPWVGMATGRSALNVQRGDVNWLAQGELEHDLKAIKQSGIQLNLLLNGNCDGGRAMSRYLQNQVCSLIDHVWDVSGGLDSVTVTSPFVAAVIKRFFGGVKVRASVNMRIGTPEGMEVLLENFDGFYLQRDYNRDFDRIRRMKAFADKNGKTLHLLANSGCMRFCSAQTFHDNAVAHEADILETQNVEDFSMAACWQFYKKPENQWKLLRNTWIRPEDLHHYEAFFPVAKLATRASHAPLRILRAYAAGHCAGNLLDLMEPNHSPLLGNRYISNSRLPEDWFAVTSGCGQRCEDCGYCRHAFENALTEIPEIAVEQ